MLARIKEGIFLFGHGFAFNKKPAREWRPVPQRSLAICFKWLQATGQITTGWD
jgi:hypothetical protein